MAHPKYPHLMEPITLANTVFRNRIFASPTGPQFLNPEQLPTPETIAYYERKALGGAASVCIGDSVVDSVRGRVNWNHIPLDKRSSKAVLCCLTDALSRHGAIASTELQHAGMYARDSYRLGSRIYGPVECECNGLPVLAMTEEIIEETIQAFANAAAFAKQCGFGMVTIHGGHGWLITQFLSPYINKRKDRWGGSTENRCRFAVAVCDAVRKACGPDFPIEMRISGSECFDGGYDIAEGVKIAKQLDGHLDLIHVSAGQYTGAYAIQDMFTVTHPSMFGSEGHNGRFAAEIKKHVSTPVATVGGISDPDFMEEVIASGKADVVEAARGLICDPDLPNKVRSGREGEVRKCMRCFTCFSGFMNTNLPRCAINPVIGRELEFSVQPLSADKKRVLVAGGGIGGMTAAITAADRGHEVILCEKSDRLGGVLLCERDVPFKERLGDYIAQTVRGVEKRGIRVLLGTPATPELAKELGPDAIIAALGSRPIVPRIPGIDGENAAGAEDIYKDPSRAGGRAVIIGAGLVGAELGIYLAMLGKEVEIIELADKLNVGSNKLHGIAIDQELRRLGINLRFNTRAVRITPSGLVCESGGETFELGADSVIYAAGREPRRAEADALRYAAREFYQIGDCLVPGDVYEANRLAFNAAMDIGKRLWP